MSTENSKFLRNTWEKISGSSTNHGKKFWLDCSSFVGKVLNLAGLSVYNAGQTTASLPDSGKISRNSLQTGDLVYTNEKSNHVGIFVGFTNDNKIIAYECFGAEILNKSDHKTHIKIYDDDSHWVHKTIEGQVVSGCFSVNNNQKKGSLWKHYYRIQK